MTGGDREGAARHNASRSRWGSHDGRCSWLTRLLVGEQARLAGGREQRSG